MVDLIAMREDSKIRITENIFQFSLEDDIKLFQDKVQALCGDFLILACASLYAELKVDMFFLNLCRCTENWRRFLQVSRQHYQQEPTLHFNTPILAGLITQYTPLLQELKSALPTQWQKGLEYQDQFHSTWLWLLLSLNGCKHDSDVQYHLNELEKSGTAPSHTLMFKALLKLDNLKAKDFMDELFILAYGYDEKVQQQIDDNAYILTFLPHRCFWFEGIVWLKLARKVGYIHNDELRSFNYCPEEAFGDMKVPYTGDWTIFSDAAI